MKTLDPFRPLALAASCMFLSPACFAAITQPCGEPTTVALLAGRDIPVGTVSVANDATDVCVTYQTARGWRILQTHLHFARTLADFPLTKTGNPVVGHFTYK